MKRIAIYFLLSLSISVVCAQSSGVRGDVNGDGEVTTADVTEIYSIILGTDQPALDPAVQAAIDDMVSVAGGAFSMGATAEQASEANSDEYPVRTVTLSSFKIARHEVTQKLWVAVMGSNPSVTAGDSLPVTNVSHGDCAVFIERLNALTGLSFRLPTEAEWEYAARGGQLSKGYKYAGGNDAGLVAWSSDNSGKALHKVGELAPNELGLYDMSGNVNEWCSDWYGAYDAAALSNPQGPDTGTTRVFRGGAFNFVVGSCRVSMRLGMWPDYRNDNVGLRLAMN